MRRCFWLERDSRTLRETDASLGRRCCCEHYNTATRLLRRRDDDDDAVDAVDDDEDDDPCDRAVAVVSVRCGFCKLNGCVPFASACAT